jgi:hypothetical protein
MYMPPNPSQDIRGAEQRNRELRSRRQDEAARRAQLGIQRPRLRESIRRLYRRLTGSKPAEQ